MMRIACPGRQHGQAMTEFQIAAVYILVPLFLFIPLLGKYIDIKHAAIGAARYQAWEYTAWHNPADNHDIMTNFTAASVPKKSPGQTTTEAQQRFFSAIREGDDAVPISTSDRTDGWDAEDRNPLWTDHRAEPLFTGTMASTINTSDDTPGFKIFGIDSGDVISFILDALDFVFDAFGTLLSIIPGNSGAEFSAINTDGYIRSSVTAPVRMFPNAIDVYDGASFQNIPARAGVLSESWNSGGTLHTYSQVGGAVPATLLKELLTMPVLGEIWDVIAFLAPELTRCKPTFHSPLVGEDGSLWLGYVDSDTVHPDRLSGGGTHVCDDAGRCRLKPNIPMSHTECVK
ncbi:MAG: hypothetical protein WD750_04545 [Gammaproteobacteria bacterium]